MARTIILLIIINCLTFSLFSLDHNFISTEIVDESLNRDINFIFQDSTGFMWILTSDGMLRYDGRTFNLFNYDPLAAPGTSFNDSKFLSAAEDDNGMLWVGTAGGLNRFDPRTLQISAVQNAPLGENRIEQIVCADALFVRSGGSIYLQYSEDENFEQIFRDEPINAMAASSDGKMYFVSRRGILHSITVKDHQYELHTFDVSIGTDINALALYFINGKQFIIAGDINGKLYQVDEDGIITNSYQAPSAINDIALMGSEIILACDSGLYLFHFEQKSFTPLLDHTDDSFNVVYAGSDGTSWAGGWDTGLIKILPSVRGVKRLPHHGGSEEVMHTLFPSFVRKDSLWTTGEENEIIETSFQSKNVQRYTINSSLIPRPDLPNTIKAFIPLSDDRFIIGTVQGLFSFDNAEKTFELILDKAAYSLLRIESSGELWAGSDNIIIRYNPEDGIVSEYRAGNGQGTYLFADSKERIWASFGEEGFYCLEKGSDSFTYYGSDIYNFSLGEIIEDSSHTIWFRTDYSLFSYTEGSDGLTLLPLPHPLVWDICADPEGGILIAGEMGAFRYDESELIPISGTENLPALSIERDSRGTIWIGTYGGGLIKYDKGKTPIQYTSADGLQSNTVYWTYEDSRGRIWIGCQRGMAIFYQAEERLTPLQLDDANTGDYFLQWSLKKLGNNIFHAATRETNLFIDTSQVSITKKSYPFVISSVNAGNRNLAPAEWEHSLDLSWEERFVDISFSVLDYTSPEDIVYEYRFSENSEWNHLGKENRIVLAGFSPGKHTLLVRAYSSRLDSIPESRYLSFKINAASPLWRSPFALIVYLLIAAAACIVAFKLYRQRKDNALKSWKIETVEMITHNLKTTIGLLMQSAEDLSNTDKNKFTEKCNAIQKNTALVADELESIMDSIKFGIDPSRHKNIPVDICAAVPGYIQEFKNLAEQKQIHISLDYPKDAQYFVDLEISGFEKMLQNIMDNAFAYAKSEIAVSINIEGKVVYIDFFDDGDPIPEENIHLIFKRGWTSRGLAGHGLGLAFADEYMQKSGGSISVKNCSDKKGKSFIFQFPVSTVDQDIDDRENLPILLIVEDDNELRNYLKNMLSFDFIVISVSSYMEALAHIKEYRPPDIILMDRMLGSHDGIEILKQLKNTLMLSSLPLVFLSGISETEKRIEALNLGAADYITKPFQIEELRIRLLSICHRDQILIQAFKERILQLEPIPQMLFSERNLPDHNLRKRFYKEKRLSEREIEIVEFLLLMGNTSDKEIAQELHIAIPTVKNHKSKIFQKLGISKREKIIDVLIDAIKKQS
jgi:DNA-binding NarL/FixJ family response regulator/signal transduction histidine kinase/ligand-binding sensor domain-containing protein